MRRLAIRAWRWPAVALLVGCGGAPLEARDGRHRLAEGLRAGDAVVLGELSGTAPETLAPAIEDARAELAARGEMLAEAPMTESARVHLRSGGVVVLVRQDGEWRVDRGVLGAPALGTPAEALAAFAAALSRVRASHVTSVLTRGARLLFADELDRWSRGLADVDAVPIVIEGEHATASLPTGVVVELTLEAGEWRVEDVHE